MSDRTVVKSGGPGFLSILTIIFVIAKLAGAISWSWWLVFLPVLVTPIILLVMVLIAAIAIVAEELE